MDEFDQLNLVAEIAAALLGFIAVFTALSRPDGRFAHSDRHFIQAMVMNAALAIVLAMSPRTFDLFFDDAMVWTSSTLLALVLGSMTMALQAWQQYRMPRDEADRIHWAWHFVAWSIAICIAVLFVLAIVDTARTSAYFVAGVSMMIPLSLTVFIGVVFRRFF